MRKFLVIPYYRVIFVLQKQLTMTQLLVLISSTKLGEKTLEVYQHRITHKFTYDILNADNESLADDHDNYFMNEETAHAAGIYHATA